MNWIKLEENNLPDIEALFTNGVDYLIGYVYYDDEAEYIIAEDDNTSLHKCTYYCILEQPN